MTFLAKKDAFEAKRRMNQEIVDGRRLVVRKTNDLLMIVSKKNVSLRSILPNQNKKHRVQRKNDHHLICSIGKISSWGKFSIFDK